MITIWLKAIISGGLVLTLVPVLALAQNFNATLSGRVTDPSGAAIPGTVLTLISSTT